MVCAVLALVVYQFNTLNLAKTAAELGLQTFFWLLSFGAVLTHLELLKGTLVNSFLKHLALYFLKQSLDQ